MESFLQDWAQLVLRWVHVLAAIAWIGHAFLFHSLEAALRRPEVDGVDPSVQGELWMVHGGGFFRMQKTRVLPRVFTGELHWFKYEALLTWVTGFLLLLSLYWLTGGVLMVDPTVAELSPAAAVAVGAGALVFGWVGYDLLWASGMSARLATPLTVLWIGAIAVGMTWLLSGRAAFLHTGALLGTLMTANVWMRILPGSRRMVRAVEAGEVPDPKDAAVGHQRSLHNGYLHFPIVFLMISAHYPRTYAHAHNGVVLLLMLVLGAAMRQVFYDGRRAAPPVWAAVIGSLVALGWLTAPAAAPGPVPDGAHAGEPIGEVSPVSGTVTLLGDPPPPRELTLVGGCELEADGPVIDDAVRVADGKLQNALLYLSSGWERWAIPPAPTDEVVVDQRGCVYAPRVHGVRVGQPVTFVNSDPLFHNVRSVARDNEVFNLNMPAKDQRITRHFGRPEVAVQVRCDVHPWMVARIGVFAHDWWAISGAQGRFELPDVPPGTYVLTAWHEVAGTASQPVRVEAGTRTTVDVRLQAP